MDIADLEERLKRHLDTISIPRNPKTHKSGRRVVLEYLEAELRSFGRPVELGTFERENLKGANLLSLPVDGEPSFLVVAHHDTVDHSPGADDNGSAVAVALELARLCPKVAFLFPDLEEEGLLGARHWVETSRLVGTVALVLESVGYWTETPGTQAYPSLLPHAFPIPFSNLESREFRGNFWTLLYLEKESSLAEALKLHLTQNVIDFELTPDHVSHFRDFGRSDHLAFWEASRACLMLTDSANFRNPNYHKPSDTVETLNLDAMSELTFGLYRFLEHLERNPLCEEKTQHR